MECKKCKAPASVTLRQRDSYCAQCFIILTSHKFRSCLGKNRVLNCNEKVVLGVSGGISSAVLLDLVHDGIKLKSHKILRVNPVCVHINGFEDNVDAGAILNQCKQYGLDVYIIPLSDYIKSDLVLPAKNCIPLVTKEGLDKFNINWKKHSSTSWNDIIVKLKRNMLIRVAKALQCSYILTAENSTTLARNLLSNLAMGRGSQIEHDTGFLDSRNDSITILRPMKDISQEELDYYSSLKNVAHLEKSNIQDNSLQSLIQTFVVDLQKNFPATISTVCKTSDKIGTYGNATKLNKQCSFCQSDIIVKSSKLTAHEATNFSKAVCHGRLLSGDSSPENLSPNVMKNDIMYCYACRRNQGLFLQK